MSLVVYRNGLMASDSIMMLGNTQLRAPKVFPYRTATGESGVFGFVGNVSAAHDLMKAYLQGGEDAYRKELSRLSDIHEELWCEMLIVPRGGTYMLIAGGHESLCRVPVQDVAIGFSTAVDQATALMRKGDMSAMNIINEVITLQECANDRYVSGPVQAHIKSVAQEELTTMKQDPIDGQFIL